MRSKGNITTYSTILLGLLPLSFAILTKDVSMYTNVRRSLKDKRQCETFPDLAPLDSSHPFPNLSQWLETLSTIQIPQLWRRITFRQCTSSCLVGKRLTSMKSQDHAYSMPSATPTPEKCTTLDSSLQPWMLGEFWQTTLSLLTKFTHWSPLNPKYSLKDIIRLYIGSFTMKNNDKDICTLSSTSIFITDIEYCFLSMVYLSNSPFSMFFSFHILSFIYFPILVFRSEFGTPIVRC